MKKQVRRQWVNIACLLFACFSTVTVANAQTTSGDITKNTSGVLNGTVKVVDSKGTVKYLQAKNGITTLTNTTTDATTTTWQLGGVLTDNTYIDVSGKTFSLDGLSLVTNVSTASTNAADKTVHTGGTAGTGETVSAETGWTVLIRDEATGAIEKIKLSDLLNVVAGHSTFNIDGTTYTAGTSAISFDAGYGTTTTPVLNVNKVSVYRNGAKLLVTTDYIVDASTGKENFVKLTPVTNDWQFYVGDVIEVHWVK